MLNLELNFEGDGKRIREENWPPECGKRPGNGNLACANGLNS